MKKKFIPLFFVLLVSTFSYAQHFRGGFQAGMVHSRLTDGYDKNWSTGFLFGANMNYDILKMEINYIRKGGTSVVYNSSIGWYDKYQVGADYIQIPLSVHFSSEDDEDGSLRYDFECGLAPAKLLDSFAKKNYISFISAYNYKNFTTDIFCSAGLDFGDHMFLDLRFSWSLFPDIHRNAILKGFFWQTLGLGHSITNQVVLRFTFGKD